MTYRLSDCIASTSPEAVTLLSGLCEMRSQRIPTGVCGSGELGIASWEDKPDRGRGRQRGRENCGNLFLVLSRNDAVDEAAERGVHAASPSYFPGARLRPNHYSVNKSKRRERRAPPAFLERSYACPSAATASFRLNERFREQASHHSEPL